MINNCISEVRIPASYSLELDLAAIKATRRQRLIANREGKASAKVKLAVVGCMSSLASPVAGTLGCIRNFCICEPKAGCFDLARGITYCLAAPFRLLSCCFQGRSTYGSLASWHSANKKFFDLSSNNNWQVDLLTCYPECDRKVRYDKNMSLINRTYLKVENPDNYNNLIFFDIVRSAIDTNDRQTLDFLELKQVFQNETMFQILMILFFDRDIVADESLPKLKSRIESMQKSMYFFLKNQCLFAYKFDDFDINFSRISTIYKFEEIQLNLRNFIKEQLKILEDIDKKELPVVLKELIIDYAMPLGTIESEEELKVRKEHEMEKGRKIENELDPEKVQLME